MRPNGKNASSTADEDCASYTVVVNHQEQYSIWPANQECPAGWKGVGKTGSKSDCLAFVKEVWTDMRPLSLRRRMAENEDWDT